MEIRQQNTQTAKIMLCIEQHYVVVMDNTKISKKVAHGQKQLKFMENTQQQLKEIIIRIKNKESGHILLMTKPQGQKHITKTEKLGIPLAISFIDSLISPITFGIQLKNSFFMKGKELLKATFSILTNLCNKQIPFRQCGNYLMGGIKKGKWIELEQNSIIFDQQKQIYSFICSEGSYADGLKEGPWESTLYEQYEHQVHTHLVSKGEYQKGKKTGNWTEPIGYSSKATMQTIITGNYENNLKNGHWSLEDGQKDLYPDEDYDHEGNYNLDKKVDNWKEIRIYQNFHVDSIIRIQDEGQYNDDGQRNDNWTSKTSGHTGNYFYQNGVLNGEAELYDCIGNLKIVLTRSKGQFNNGKKNGRWKTSINIDEKWMLYDVGEYVDDIKVGLWRESQYFDQYILEQTEKDQGQILLIKEGHYGNNGKKKDEWTWRFKCLSGDYNENQIFNIIGKEVHTENQIIGNMILFEETFGKYYARFYFCDIFDGQIFNGYRNGEWKFSVIQDLIQNEINSKDTDSEQEQNLDEEEQNIEEEDHNSNNEEEQEQEEHNDNDNNDNKEEEENNNNEEENEIEQQNSGEEGDDQEDPGNQVFQVYQNGIVIPP